LDGMDVESLAYGLSTPSAPVAGAGHATPGALRSHAFVFAPSVFGLAMHHDNRVTI